MNRFLGVKKFNHDVYLAIDNDVPFAGVSTDEEIIAELQPELAPAIEPDPATEPEPRISKRDANKHLQALKLFLMQSDNDCSESLKILSNVEKDLECKRNVMCI